MQARDFLFLFFLYGLPTAPSPPTPPLVFLWRRSDFPAPGEQREQDSVRMHLCVLQCVSALLCACAHAQPGPGRPSPSPLCALKNEGGNLRAAVIIHPSKRTGRRRGRRREGGGEGGMDGGRKKERAKREGWRERWGGYINSYHTVFGILHPRMRSCSPSLFLTPPFSSLSTVLSFRSLPLRFSEYLAFSAYGRVFVTPRVCVCF